MTVEDWEFTNVSRLIEGDGSIKTGPFGTVLKASEYSNEGVPLISVREIGYGTVSIDERTPRVSKSVSDRMPEYLLNAGDIVFARKGAVDRSALIASSQSGWFLGSDGIRLRLPLSCDARFVSYIFQAPSTKFWLIQHATGTTMPSLNQAILSRVPLLLPPIETQRTIAAVLGTLDDKIAQNRRTAQKLEQLARAVFRAWFVDFEPVKAKAAGATSFPLMSPALFNSLPTAFVPSKRGPVPAEWETKPIASIATFLNGLALQKYPPKSDSTDLPVIKIAQLRQGSTSGADLANANIPAEYVIKNRDLLFSWSGTLEVEFWFGGKGALNQHIFKVSSQHYPDWFVLLSLQEHLPWFKMIAASKATTMGHIKREHLLGVHAVIATTEVMREADALIGPLHNLRAHLLLESQRLANLRDQLLPRLLSGQVQVAAAGNLHG